MRRESYTTSAAKQIVSLGEVAGCWFDVIRRERFTLRNRHAPPRTQQPSNEQHRAQRREPNYSIVANCSAFIPLRSTTLPVAFTFFPAMPAIFSFTDVGFSFTRR